VPGTGFWGTFRANLENKGKTKLEKKPKVIGETGETFLESASREGEKGETRNECGVRNQGSAGESLRGDGP